ncbi:MAG TPA: hypothetical protein PKL73_15145 [Polyangiaceae bacterium]|nr:hypothetical protein [Polyangiaceae bacterium]HNZ22711.1 hypothetical protein [Polyangiaceae bacterium]HOD24346.1 hypothetical protein [Polyangiaceae bacterium]HOE49245.1 hypothetical protein [Polyangiaceae bacterium]HOH00380.1 hypothetical protein [Polyangiaceae bacterium]
MPAPDPNRPSGWFGAPIYRSPVLPPLETEHKTFELRTVRLFSEFETKAPSPGLTDGRKQMDIPTVPTVRVQRRRLWVRLLWLQGWGIVVGIGILLYFWLTQP